MKKHSCKDHVDCDVETNEKPSKHSRDKRLKSKFLDKKKYDKSRNESKWK